MSGLGSMDSGGPGHRDAATPDAEATPGAAGPDTNPRDQRPRIRLSTLSHGAG